MNDERLVRYNQRIVQASEELRTSESKGGDDRETQRKPGPEGPGEEDPEMENQPPPGNEQAAISSDLEGFIHSGKRMGERETEEERQGKVSKQFDEGETREKYMV